MNDLEQYTMKMTAKGWQILYKTDSTVQLKRPRQWNRLLLIVGLLTIPVFGIGVVILILALVDYLIKPERVISVTDKQLAGGKEPVIPSDWAGPTAVFIIIVGGLLLLILFVLLLGALA